MAGASIQRNIIGMGMIPDPVMDATHLAEFVLAKDKMLICTLRVRDSEKAFFCSYE